MVDKSIAYESPSHGKTDGAIVSRRGTKQKVAVITGASSGFGLATSILMAQKGYRVFGGSRHPESVNGNYSQNFESLEVDVQSGQSVEAFMSEVLKRSDGSLDVLINNAGYATIGALEEMTAQEAMNQLDTNLFGVMRMVNSVLPVMRKQKSGHIINIGSIVGHIPVPFSGLYSTSKFALEGYTEQLRLEIKNFGINVSILEPGYFKTNLLNSSKYVSRSIDAYKEIRTRANAVLQGREENGQDPILVAHALLKIIESRKPGLHYPVGKDRRALFFKRVFPQSSFESQISRIFGLDVR